MNSFKEFHEDKVLNEAAVLALPALLSGAEILKSLAISLLVAKAGYEALTSDSVASGIDAITNKEIETISPLTTASPEAVVDAIAPQVTAEGTVAATAESASAISSALGVAEGAVQAILTYAAGIGLSPLAVSLIFGAGVALTTVGTYKFIKGNGPKKFKNLMSKALKALFKALKLAGKVAIRAFTVLLMGIGSAIAQAFSWLVTAIGSGAVAIIKAIVNKFKKEDKEEEVRDLEGFELN